MFVFHVQPMMNVEQKGPPLVTQLFTQVAMETLPIGWTVHTCDQEGDGTGLLVKGGIADINTNTHVHDLFHEDAQVGCQLKYLSD